MLYELLYQVADVYEVLNEKDIFNTSTPIYIVKHLNIRARKNLKNVSKKIANGKFKVLPNRYKLYIQDDIAVNEMDTVILSGNIYDIKHVYRVFDHGNFHHIELIVDKVADNIGILDYWITEDSQFAICTEENELILFD